MWRPMCPILASTSLLVICAAAAHAQTFAPSTLEVARHDQKSANDMVQVITDKSARAITKEQAPVITDKPVQAVTKKRSATATKKPAQPIVKEPAPAIAKDSAQTFAMEPVRPMNEPTVSKKEQPVSRFTLDRKSVV